jgi:hypothetical protein
MNDPTTDITTVIETESRTDPEGVRIRKRLASMDGTRERLFRINSGLGWVGRMLKRTTDTIILGGPRPLRAAPTGWPDLCGWTSVTITPEMVGQTVAIFLAEEFKGKRDSLRPEQAAFRSVLERMGGLYRVVRPCAARK